MDEKIKTKTACRTAASSFHQAASGRSLSDFKSRTLPAAPLDPPQGLAPASLALPLRCLRQNRLPAEAARPATLGS